MQYNPTDDHRSSDSVLFQGWSLALDCKSLPPVPAQDLPRFMTLSRLTGMLESEMQTLDQVTRELTDQSSERDIKAFLAAAQSLVPMTSALCGAINQIPEGQHKTALQASGQIALASLESAQSAASLLIDAIREQEDVVEVPVSTSSSLVAKSSANSDGELSLERKQQNEAEALTLMRLLLEEATQETVSPTSVNSASTDSEITFSPSVSLALSQLHVLLQKDPELPRRIIGGFVSTAFQSNSDSADAAEVLTMVLSLFENLKDTSLRLGGILRTADALAANAERTTKAYLEILRGDSTTEPLRPSKSNLLSAMRVNVETYSGGLKRLHRLLDYSLAESG